MKYLFEHCEIDVDSHQLLVDGIYRTVEPQVFALLQYMIENAGRLISREELVQIVWHGRIVSDSAISARISAARSAVGDSGAKQAIIKTIPRCGFRFIADVSKKDTTNTIIPPKQLDLAALSPIADTHGSVTATTQKVRFCTSRDGSRIAFATTGSGYPMVKTGHWLTHIELDWQSPIWHPFLKELGQYFRLTRYDQRGTGLSDWSVSDFSLDCCVEDLEAVVAAAGIERFALYGASQGVPTAIAYAVRHPERVSHLILRGGYVRGRLVRGSTAEREEGEAMLTLIRHEWGKPGSAFIKAFSSMYIPDSSQDQIDALVELQRQTASPDNVVALRSAVDRFDVSDILGRINVPTLVMHARNDSVQPLEQGRKLAAGIKDAVFIMLESSNHVVLPHEPAWDVFFQEIKKFVLQNQH